MTHTIGTTTFVNRADWGAPAVTAGSPVPADEFLRLAAHHTVTDWRPSNREEDVAAHMRYLRTVRPDLGLEVPYSWVILEDPDPQRAWVGEGRGRARSGAHTIGHNSTAYGVAFAGDYRDRQLTPGMIRAFRLLAFLYLVDPAAALPTLAHRDVFATACPGIDAAQMTALQPPFLPPAPPMESQPMTITPDAIATVNVTTREYDHANGSFKEITIPWSQVSANAHIEATQAHMAAEDAAVQAANAAASARLVGIDVNRTFDMAKLAFEAAEDAGTAAHAVLAALTPMQQLTAELLAEAFMLALRTLLLPKP